MSKTWHDFPEDATDDLICALLEKRLDNGAHRTVYAMRDHRFVVKVERPGSFQNVMEWEMWLAASGTPLAEWLAPCLYLSPGGRVLVQHRTKPLYDIILPKKIPAALTDCKVQNFGLLEGKIVCHDYGMTLALESGARSKKMKTVNWWDGNSGKYLVSEE